MYKNNYWTIQNAIPKEICNTILNSISWENSSDGLINGADGKQTKDENLRKVSLTFHEGFSTIGCIFQSFLGYVNSTAEWNFQYSQIEDIQIAKYESGGHYGWHQDVFGMPNEEGLNRKLSIVAVLNDKSEFEGGNFEFKNMDEQPILEQGSILVFPSMIEHRVLPVTKGIRYSAFTWARGLPFR